MPDSTDRLTAFKDDLKVLEPRQVVQKHITFGETAVLSQTQHFGLRTAVADRFGIHPHEVVVVGSAKLGFSIKPSRRYGRFGDTSDIDLALVSADLFVRQWRELQVFLDGGGYWERIRTFQERFFDGWIRPDLMPMARQHSPTREWWEFFRSLTASGKHGPYKIAAGLYFDWSCLERYQVRAVSACKQEVRDA